MGERRAEGMTRHAARALADHGWRKAAAEQAPAEIDERAEDHIERDTGQDHADRRTAAPGRENGHEAPAPPQRRR